MAVRLRPQSAAWMAPHALAAQLTAQTGQIAGQGVAGLLGGIAQGVGAFTQKREARRAEAINESRYQDSLGMRREEMDLRKQQAALEDTQGRYAILSQAQKGVDVKLALWELNNPGAPPPPELLSEKEQLSSSLKAVMAGAMKGVPMPQATARAMPATGVVVNGKPMSEMTDAELNDLMDKSARGEVDYSYRGGATGDMGQGVGGTPKPAAASSRIINDGGVMSGGAAPEVAAPGMPDVPSSGDPVADRFTAEMGRLSASIQEMEDRADKIEKLGPGSSRLRSQIAEAKTRLLTMQGRYQVYSADRTKRQSQEMQAEDEVRKRAADRDSIASLQKDLESKGLMVSLPKDDIEAARKVYNDLVVTDPNSEMAAKRKAEAAKVRAENQKSLVDYRAQKALEHAKAMEAIKEPAARAKAHQDALDQQKDLVKQLKSEYELLKNLQGKGLVGADDPDLVGAEGRPSAWDRYETERNVLMDMMKSGASMAPVAPAASGSSGWAPVTWARSALGYGASGGPSTAATPQVAASGASTSPTVAASKPKSPPDLSGVSKQVAEIISAYLSRAQPPRAPFGVLAPPTLPPSARASATTEAQSPPPDPEFVSQSQGRFAEGMSAYLNPVADARPVFGVSGPPPKVATPAAAADAKASAASEFKSLPKEQQTLEAWTAIKAKYGIK